MMKREATFSRSSRANTLVLIFASILLLFQQNCLANAKQHPQCPPSSCGKIHNITHPFRLKGDPSNCGDPRYELDCSFIPRYYLNEASFKDVVGPDDFGSEPFILDPIDPFRIAYFTCANPIKDDPRYVKVDTSRCGTRGRYVYAVLEPSLFQYRVGDIKVGCDLMVATLATSSLSENSAMGNVSYGEIHRMIIEGFEVSWLPVICEDRCGKWTNCQVVNESNGEVQCDKRFCHYAYQTTDKCELSQQIFGYTRAYVRGVIFGLGSRITFSTKNLDNPVGLEYFDGGIFIGRNVLPSYVAARCLFGVALLLVLLIYKWR